MKQESRLPNAMPSDPQFRLPPLFLLQLLHSHREKGLKRHRTRGCDVGTETEEEAGSEAAPTIAIEESLLRAGGTPGAGEQEPPGTGWWEGPGKAAWDSDFPWTAVPSIRPAENGPGSN